MSRNNGYRLMIAGISAVLAFSSCQESAPRDRFAKSRADGEHVSENRVPKRDLTLAAANGQTARVRELLRQGADANESIVSDGNRMTPLMGAILHSHVEIVRALVSRGATDTGEYLGYTGRDFALFKNQDDIVNLLDSIRK